jgi:hypothetical protein
MAVLNFDLVSSLHLASATTQLRTMVADIESMSEMAAIFNPGDPESYWHDRFGSLRLPFPCARSRHVPRPLRVAVVGFLVIIVIFAVALVFLLRLLPRPALAGLPARLDVVLALLAAFGMLKRGQS